MNCGEIWEVYSGSPVSHRYDDTRNIGSLSAMEKSAKKEGSG